MRCEIIKANVYHTIHEEIRYKREKSDDKRDGAKEETWNRIYRNIWHL